MRALICLEGWDGQDVNWKCEAVLPKGAHLANVEVQCEGFDYPEDPYILAGSCGVSFEVVGGPAHHTSARAAAPSSDPRSGGDEAWSLWSYFKLGVFLLIFWKFCSCCCGGTRANPASPREGHRNAPQHSAYPYAYASCASAVPVPATATASSDPGFLAGLGVGAALGSAYERSRYGLYTSMIRSREYNIMSLFHPTNCVIILLRAPTAPVESSRRRGGGSDDAAAADDSGTEERSTAYAKTKRR